MRLICDLIRRNSIYAAHLVHLARALGLSWAPIVLFSFGILVGVKARRVPEEIPAGYGTAGISSTRQRICAINTKCVPRTEQTRVSLFSFSPLYGLVVFPLSWNRACQTSAQEEELKSLETNDRGFPARRFLVLQLSPWCLLWERATLSLRRNSPVPERHLSLDKGSTPESATTAMCATAPALCRKHGISLRHQSGYHPGRSDLGGFKVPPETNFKAVAACNAPDTSSRQTKCTTILKCQPATERNPDRGAPREVELAESEIQLSSPMLLSKNAD